MFSPTVQTQPYNLSKGINAVYKAFQSEIHNGAGKKGVRLTTAELNPLFSFRIVYYMCLANAPAPPPPPPLPATEPKRCLDSSKLLKKLITFNNYLPTKYKALF